MISFLRPTTPKIILAAIFLSIPGLANLVKGISYVFTNPESMPVQSNLWVEVLTWIQSVLFFPINQIGFFLQTLWLELALFVLYSYFLACLVAFLLAKTSKKNGAG